jgi:vacuolar-type H+-ATPase subunit F/Vma7
MASPETPQPSQTRMLFLGDDGLADGFRLIGFEVHASPKPDDVERMLRELQREREHAFVIVDDAIMRADIPALKQVLDEGGRIVVIAVPPLAAPAQLSSSVAERLAAMFGNVGAAR